MRVMIERDYQDEARIPSIADMPTTPTGAELLQQHRMKEGRKYPLRPFRSHSEARDRFPIPDNCSETSFRSLKKFDLR